MSEPLYQTDSWNGIPHYVCVGCGYDTLQLARITDHTASCSVLSGLPRYVCQHCGYETLDAAQMAEHGGSCPAGAALAPVPVQAEGSLSSPSGSTPPSGPPDPPPTDPPQHVPVEEVL